MAEGDRRRHRTGRRRRRTPAAFAAERIGIDFTEDQILTSLQDLGAVVEKTGTGYP